MSPGNTKAQAFSQRRPVLIKSTTLASVSSCRIASATLQPLSQRQSIAPIRFRQDKQTRHIEYIRRQIPYIW